MIYLTASTSGMASEWHQRWNRQMCSISPSALWIFEWNNIMCSFSSKIFQFWVKILHLWVTMSGMTTLGEGQGAERFLSQMHSSAMCVKWTHSGAKHISQSWRNPGDVCTQCPCRAVPIFRLLCASILHSFAHVSFHTYTCFCVWVCMSVILWLCSMKYEVYLPSVKLKLGKQLSLYGSLSSHRTLHNKLPSFTAFHDH